MEKDDGHEVRQFLRHTLATLAYRAGKALRGASAEFGRFQVGSETRTPMQILAHVNDLLDWAMNLAEGEYVWNDSTPGEWGDEVDRFFVGMERLDERLSADRPLGFEAEKIFQGPIADALSHVGQIAMLRRLAGEPIKGESYFKAEIERGRVGDEQVPPEWEFD